MATTAPDGAAPAPSRAFVLGHLAVASLFWGASFLFIKLMEGAVSPWAVAAGRGTIAATALALWLVARGQSPLPRRGELRHWLILGTTNGWLPNVLVAYALIELASGPAAMIQAGGPLVTAVAAHWLFAEERLTRRRIAGIGLGLCGVALLIGPGLFQGGGGALAVLAMVGVMLAYSAGNLYARAVPASAGDPGRLALGQQAVSGAVALALMLAVSGPAAVVPALAHWPAMLALGLIATAVPMLAFMRLIRAAGPTRAALTGYLVPAVATGLGILLLGETLELRQALGGCIILAGVFLTTGARRAGAA